MLPGPRCGLSSCVVSDAWLVAVGKSSNWARNLGLIQASSGLSSKMGPPQFNCSLSPNSRRVNCQDECRRNSLEANSSRGTVALCSSVGLDNRTVTHSWAPCARRGTNASASLSERPKRQAWVSSGARLACAVATNWTSDCVRESGLPLPVTSLRLSCSFSESPNAVPSGKLNLALPGRVNLGCVWNNVTIFTMAAAHSKTVSCLVAAGRWEISRPFLPLSGFLPVSWGDLGLLFSLWTERTKRGPGFLPTLGFRC